MTIKQEHIYKSTKAEFGIKIIDNKKYFYKKTKNFNKEIQGFNEVNSIYIIPKIVACNNDEILYEYKKELESKTIHEYLYSKYPIYINYYKIFKQYTKSIQKLVIQDENTYRNSDFFNNRIKMLDKYISYKQFDNIYCQNNKEFSVKKIIQEIKEVLEKPKRIKGILTMGDPTDTNIATNGLFTDFECAGYNSILGEIAILFISLTTHGSYFYPKYNSNAYILRTNLLYDFYKYKQELVYFKNPDNKYILLPKFTILKKNKIVLLKFLNFYYKHFKDDLELKQYLKYYICMRILTPLDITNMEEYDRMVIISLLINIYENCTDIESLIKMIKKMKVKNI